MTILTDLLSLIFNTVVFKLIATGAEMKISLGFKPDFLLIYNKTNPSLHVWTSTMAAASELQIGNHASTQLTNIASAGIDVFAGELGGADGTNDFYIKGSTLLATVLASGADIGEGFKIGTDAVLNTGSDELHILALKIG